MEPTKASSAPQPPPILIVDDTDASARPPPDRLAHEASFLSSSPGSSFLSPSFAMPADGDVGEATSAPAAPNPFNFQTQVISTSPVKSVRYDIHEAAPSPASLTSSHAEHWPTSWPQIQA